MKKVLSAIVLLSFVLMMGCASIEKAISFNGMSLTEGSKTPIQHYNAKNWGIYVLWIPLVTGSFNNLGTPVLLQNTVTLNSAVSALTKEAAAEESTAVVDLNSSRGSMYFPPVFFYKCVQVSGNGVK